MYKIYFIEKTGMSYVKVNEIEMLEWIATKEWAYICFWEKGVDS